MVSSMFLANLCDWNIGDFFLLVVCIHWPSRVHCWIAWKLLCSMSLVICWMYSRQRFPVLLSPLSSVRHCLGPLACWAFLAPGSLSSSPITLHGAYAQGPPSSTLLISFHVSQKFDSVFVQLLASFSVSLRCCFLASLLASVLPFPSLCLSLSLTGAHTKTDLRGPQVHARRGGIMRSESWLSMNVGVE